MQVTSRFPMALSYPRSFVKYHFERQAGWIQASWQSLTFVHFRARVLRGEITLRHSKFLHNRDRAFSGMSPS